MKQIQLVIALLLTFHYVNGQYTNTNPDFNKTGPVYNDVTLSAFCHTFSTSNIPEWFRSHGSPSFVNEPDCQYNANPIVLGYNNVTQQGSGIATPFKFKAGRRYKIRIEACPQLTTFISGSLQVKMTQEKPENLTISTSCMGTIPTPGGITTTIGTPDFSISDIELVYYDPTNDYDYLWLYPYADDGFADIELASVCITQLCDETLVLTNDPLAPGTYDMAYHIEVGPSGGLINNDPSANTELIGISSVTLFDNFLATANDNTYFLAEVGGDCYAGCGPASKNNNSFINSIKEGENTNISIFPNPANEKINVRINGKGTKSASIVIRDLTGRRVVYSDNIIRSAEQLSNHIIDIHTLPNGIYIIEVTTGQEHFTQKLVKQ